MAQKCRFCLKNFNENEVYFGITEEIKENFESLAQIKFILSTTKKNLICELCMRSLQIATLLKHQFIINQRQFLSRDDRIKIENSMTIMDTATSSKNLGHPVNKIEKPEKILVQNVNNVKNNPKAENETIRRDPVARSESTYKHPASQTSNKIVDKILLKFEKIDQSSADKTSILGTNNLKTIKKSNRNRTLTIKALNLIKQEDIYFKCPYCTESFLYKSHLSAHIMSDHKSEILRCNVCRKLFINKDDLNTHVNVLHPKERNYSCSMCSKAYTSRSTLNKHVTAKHPGSKYRCNYNSCHLTFDTFDAIRSHMVLVHPEVKFRDMFSSIAKVQL
ncbi:zinc finger protein 845-like [Chironomus tepperi]|uniref:zinc finger protein 845-like n=1 Tax=Chironomus tepperi TaxID=113505 RepID=UPI00391F0C1A